MEALKAEIARKKALMQPEKRRWVKTSELCLEREREAEALILAKHGTKRAKTTKVETVKAASPRAAAKERTATTVEDRKKLAAKRTALAELSQKELFNRLRGVGEPVTLFGEGREERTERLAIVELSGRVKQNEGFGLSGSYAMSNTFLGSSSTNNKDDILEEDEESEDEEEVVDNEGSSSKKEKKPSSPGRKLEVSDHKFIRKWISLRLKEWERDLNLRPEATKRTPQGRVSTKTYKQCKDYIRPLSKLCKSRNLEEDMRVSLAEICRFCDEGEFVRANDTYVAVAIGNAAWPIGVTSTGVHVRGVNCDQSKIAHIMNNEMQRKFLTSVKRLMKIAQDGRPDVPPSKKVM